MADKAERKAAARKAKRQMRDIKRGMTPAELESFRAKEKEMRKDQPSRLDRPKIKVISPKERAKRRKKAQEKRERRNIAKQLEAPSARDLESGERKTARLVEKRRKERAAALIAELKKIAGIPERESGSLEKFDRLNMVEETEKTGFNPRSEDYKSGISTPLKGVALAKGGMTKKYSYRRGGTATLRKPKRG